jgi:hypothetical protein
MTRSEIQSRIRVLREELENRHKYGTIKLAEKDGSPIAIETLQKELYSLIYKSSKLD